MVGKLGPKTSASKIPTLAPIPASVYARFTATVDFPTPPWKKYSFSARNGEVCLYVQS